MEKQSTRVTLRKAQNGLKNGQEDERELIERIIQEVRSTDVPIKKIIDRLVEKKQEHQRKLKTLNRVIHQIQVQDDQRKNAEGNIKPRNKNSSKKTRDSKITERSGGKTSNED